MKIPFYLLVLGSLLLFTACLSVDDDTTIDDPAVQPCTPYKDQNFTKLFRQTTGLIAADGAVSVPLDDGRSIWLYGDSYVDQLDTASGMLPCLFNAQNSATVMSISLPTVEQTLAGAAGSRTYFQYQPDPDNYFFWPGDGVQLGDTAYILLIKLRKVSTGFGFGGTGELYAAKIKVPEMTLVGYADLGYKNDIQYSCSAIQDDGWVYVHGIKDNGFGRDLHVARFPAGNIYANWQYYDGSGWSTDIAQSAAIHDAFAFSFSLSKVKDKFLLLITQFSLGCDQGKKIFAFTADRPEGPFSSKQVIWEVDDLEQGYRPFFYAANAHPEYINGKDELLIT